MNKCKKCGSCDVVATEERGNWRLECVKCGRKGPKRRSALGAVKAWNSKQ